jgi:streptogramin lyase
VIVQRCTALLGILALSACHQDFTKNMPWVTPSPTTGPALAAKTITSGITSSAIVDGVVLGPDGRNWFTQTNTAQIGAATNAGSVQQYTLATPSGYNCVQPEQIVVGPDKNLWAASYCGEVVKVTPAGAVSVYPISSNSAYASIVVGPDSNLWLGDVLNGVIDVVSTSGSLVKTVTLPTGAVPTGVALGADKNIWVADSGLTAFERVTVGGTVTSFTSGIPSNTVPHGITSGNLYVTLQSNASGTSDQIGRMTTSGTIKVLGTLSSGATPTYLCTASDGNVWFRENGTSNVLGRITISTGTLTEFTLAGILSPNSPDDGSGNGTDFIAPSGANLLLGGTGALYVVTP